MNTLPEIVGGHYDPMAQQRNMASLFGDRDTATQQMQEQVRGNILAEGNLANALSKSQLDHATNVGKLASLPQELEIAKSNRDTTQDFQFYRELKRAYFDKSLPPEAKAYVTNALIDKNVTKKMQEGGLGALSSGEGRNHKLVADELKRMFAESPDEYIANLDRLLDTTTATPESIQTRIGQREKDDAAFKRVLAEGRFAPVAGGSGGANEIKVLEHYRKGLNDTIVAMDRDLRADARADQIGIIIDSAGRVSTTQDLSQRPRDRAIYEQIKRNIEAKHGARRDAAIKMLEQIRKQYNLPYDQSVLTTGQQTQPTQAQPQTRKPLSSFGQGKQ